MNVRRSTCALAILAFFAMSLAARADLLVNTLHSPFVVDFDNAVTDVNPGTYQGNGFNASPSAGQLDSDSWAVTGMGSPTPNMSFGGSQGAGSAFGNGASSGGVSAGGIWALNVNNGAGPANWTLGFQPTTNAFNTNGSIALRVKNTTGAPVTSWSIGYDIFTFNDQAKSSTLDFWYGTSYSIDTSSFSNVGALNYSSPFTATGSTWSAALPKATTINVTVPNNGNLFLRFNIGSIDLGGAGGFDELGLDNISVTAVPEASAFVAGVLLCGAAGLILAARRFRPQTVG